MRISDWSSDVCSSDLLSRMHNRVRARRPLMLSEELQKALDAAFVSARMEGHELLTVEHLLLALLSDTHVAEALTSGGADTDKLEAALKDYIRNHIQSIRDVEKHEVQPTLSFQRVLQRAIYHVQAAGKKQVSTLNVLVAIFSEKDTNARS